jgi:hypothetical protein
MNGARDSETAFSGTPFLLYGMHPCGGNSEATRFPRESGPLSRLDALIKELQVIKDANGEKILGYRRWEEFM